MNECQISGCRNLETKCVDCGRLVVSRIMAPGTGWVSVKDKLPPIGEYVLAYDGEIIFESRFRGCEIFEAVNDKVEKAFYEKEEITHWMPLPEAPTREK